MAVSAHYSRPPPSHQLVRRPAFVIISVGKVRELNRAGLEAYRPRLEKGSARTRPALILDSEPFS
jgi:hypothetical protein